MTPLISGGRGLTLLKTAVQIAAYLLITWTYAEKQGLGDTFVQGLKELIRLPRDLLHGAATPGGGR